MNATAGARARWAVPLVAGVFVAAYRVTPVFDPDAFWHLHTGRVVLATHAVPSVDTFSHTAAGRRWDFVDWLADVLLYGAQHAGGWTGLVLLTAALGGLGVALTTERAMRWAPLRGVLAALPAIVGAGVFRVTPRPQTFTFGLFAATLLLLERPSGAWWVPALLTLWQNLHSSAPLGLLALGAHGLGRVLEHRAAGRPLDLPRTLGPVLLGAAALFVAVHPVDRLRAGFGHMVDPSLAALITEWQPAWRMPWNTPVLLAFEALVFLCVAAVAHAPTRARITPGAALVAAGCAVLAVRAMRFVPLGAIGLAPLAALGAEALLTPSRIDAGTWLRRTLVAGAVVLGVAAVVLQRKPAGTGLARGVFPEGAARWVLAHPPQGPMFNDFDDGGFLMFAFDGRHPVFADGRSWALYDPAFLHDVLVPAPERLDGLLRRFDCGFALVDADARIDTFQRRPGWSLVYFDDRAFVAVRDDRNAALQSFAYRVLRPAQWSDDVLRWSADPALGDRAWNESTRAITDAPRSSLAWVLRAAAATATRRSAEGDAAALRALHLRPDGVPAHRAVLLRCAVHGDRACVCAQAAWVLQRAPRNAFARDLGNRMGCPSTPAP